MAQAPAVTAPTQEKLFLAFGLTIVVVAAELLKPWPLKVVIDQVIMDKPWPIIPESLAGRDNAMNLALVASLAVLLFALISGIGSYFRELWLAETGQKVVNRVLGQKGL